MLIRVATDDDTDVMGDLHVRAWQSGYRGIMPDEYLDGLNPADRRAMWRGRIAVVELPPVLVAVIDGTVVGFAAFGPTYRVGEGAEVGELHAINLEPTHWGLGIGRTLLRRVTDELAAMSFTEAVLWVVPENTRARSLYASEQWSPDGGSLTEQLFGVTVAEIRYRRSLSAP